jgi:hypothetical protein
MTQATIDIADAVTAAINADACRTYLAGKLASVPTFTALRAYVPTFALKDTGTLRVLVIPTQDTSEMVSRSQDRDEHQIQIAVAKRFQTDGTADADNATRQEMDAIVTLAGAIGDYFRSVVRVPERTTATYAGKAHAPLYDAKHLFEHHQITSLVTLTFREFSTL